MMRHLMRTEALAVGLSSAANAVAACHYAERMPPGSKILTFAFDGVHDYLDALDPDVAPGLSEDDIRQADPRPAPATSEV